MEALCPFQTASSPGCKKRPSSLPKTWGVNLSIFRKMSTYLNISQYIWTYVNITLNVLKTLKDPKEKHNEVFQQNTVVKVRIFSTSLVALNKLTPSTRSPKSNKDCALCVKISLDAQPVATVATGHIWSGSPSPRLTKSHFSPAELIDGHHLASTPGEPGRMPWKARMLISMNPWRSV